MPLDLETALTFSLTAIACLAGAIIDVRTRRIPNWITFSAIVVLLVLHGGFSGLPGLKESALGLTGGFLVMCVTVERSGTRNDVCITRNRTPE